MRRRSPTSVASTGSPGHRLEHADRHLLGIRGEHVRPARPAVIRGARRSRSTTLRQPERAPRLERCPFLSAPAITSRQRRSFGNMAAILSSRPSSSGRRPPSVPNRSSSPWRRRQGSRAPGARAAASTPFGMWRTLLGSSFQVATARRRNACDGTTTVVGPDRASGAARPGAAIA